jgi:hypothetical protein
MAAAYGRGGGGGGGRWFVPGADGGGRPGLLPWGRGGGGSSRSTAAGGERETRAAVMARRAPAPSAIRRGATLAAEAAAREVVLRVHPTEEAERRRQDVIGYLKRLIGSSVGCEVRSRPLPHSSRRCPASGSRRRVQLFFFVCFAGGEN